MTYAFEEALVAIEACDEHSKGSLETIILANTRFMSSPLNQKSDKTATLGKTLLHMAIDLDANADGEKKLIRASIIQYLIEQITATQSWAFHPFRIQDAKGDTPLHAAIKRQDKTTIDALIEVKNSKSNDVSLKNTEGDTPLHLAVSLNDWNTVSQLLDNYKIDLTVKNTAGFTVLDLAKAKAENVPSEELIERLKSPAVKAAEAKLAPVRESTLQFNAKSKTLLDRALKENPSLPKEISADNGQTLLHAVIATEAKGDAVAVRSQIITALITEITKSLRWVPHPLTIQDNKGNTPLHLAVSLDDWDTATRLLDNYKIDLTVKNTAGFTVLDLAKAKAENVPSEELIERLKSPAVKAAEAKLAPVRESTLQFNAKSKTLLDRALKENPSLPKEISADNGQTLLHAVIATEAKGDALVRTQIVTTLITEITKSSLWVPHPLTIQDNEGNTPLHLAIAQKDIPLVTLLLGTGKYNLKAKNKEGHTPLHMAIRKDAWDIVILILDTKQVDLSITDGENLVPYFLTEQNHRIPSGNKYSELKERLKPPALIAQELADKQKEDAQKLAEKQKSEAEEKTFASVLAKLEKCNAESLPSIIAALGENYANYPLLKEQSEPAKQTLLHAAIALNPKDAAGKATRTAMIEYLVTGIMQCTWIVSNPLHLINAEGNTPLHLLIQHKDKETITKLVKAGQADIAAQDANGNTAVHLAIEHNEQDMVAEFLSTEKANLSLENKEKKTAYDLAFEKKFYKEDDAVQQLEQLKSSELKKKEAKEAEETAALNGAKDSATTTTTSFLAKLSMPELTWPSALPVTSNVNDNVVVTNDDTVMTKVAEYFYGPTKQSTSSTVEQTTDSTTIVSTKSTFSTLVDKTTNLLSSVTSTAPFNRGDQLNSNNNQFPIVSSLEPVTTTTTTTITNSSLPLPSANVAQKSKADPGVIAAFLAIEALENDVAPNQQVSKVFKEELAPLKTRHEQGSTFSNTDFTKVKKAYNELPLELKEQVHEHVVTLGNKLTWIVFRDELAGQPFVSPNFDSAQKTLQSKVSLQKTNLHETLTNQLIQLRIALLAIKHEHETQCATSQTEESQEFTSRLIKIADAASLFINAIAKNKDNLEQIGLAAKQFTHKTIPLIIELEGKIEGKWYTSLRNFMLSIINWWYENTITPQNVAQTGPGLESKREVALSSVPVKETVGVFHLRDLSLCRKEIDQSIQTYVAAKTLTIGG